MERFLMLGESASKNKPFASMPFGYHRLPTPERLWEIETQEDPVRPELSLEFRLLRGRKIYGIRDGRANIAAVACIALVADVPRSFHELEKFGTHTGGILVPYTLWSYKKGAGRLLMSCLIAKANRNGTTQRVITLSPQTKRAREFHTRNGAKELRVNAQTINFEYPLSWDVQRHSSSTESLALKNFKKGKPLECYLCKESFPPASFTKWEAGRKYSHRCRECMKKLSASSYMKHRMRTQKMVKAYLQDDTYDRKATDRRYWHRKNKGSMTPQMRRQYEHSKMADEKNWRTNE